MKQTQKTAQIKLVILDVDGVLTNGKLYYTAKGEEMKSFYVRDGLGLRALLKHGINVAVISGRKSHATMYRLRDLGIKHVYLGIKDKMQIFKQLKKKFGLKNENIACIGDDLPELELMQTAGFSVAVADAIPLILKRADYVTKTKGGKGAVRELCDLILGEQL